MEDMSFVCLLGKYIILYDGRWRVGVEVVVRKFNFIGDKNFSWILN